MRRRKRNLLIGLSTVVVVYLVLTWVFADRYLHPTRKRPTLPATLRDITLANTPTWVSPGWERAKVVVMMAHGYGGTRGSWREIGPALAAQGYGVVVPAMPGQDASPISSVGFGQTETKSLIDVAAAIRQTNPHANLVLLGVSLGGASSWMASDIVRPAAVITDGAFANLNDGIHGYLSGAVPGLAAVLMPVIKLAEWRSGVNPSSIRPIDHAAKWKGPALLLAGERDRIGTAKVVQEYRDAAPQIETASFPGALHAHTYASNPTLYMNSVLNFLRSHQINP